MSEQNRNKACLICSHEKFVWGYIGGYGASPIIFLPKESGVKQLAANLLAKGGSKVATRKCQGCGNLQFFADVLSSEECE